MSQEIIKKIWERYGDLQLTNRKRLNAGMNPYPFTLDPKFPQGYSYSRLFDYLEVVSNAAVDANRELEFHIRNQNQSQPQSTNWNEIFMSPYFIIGGLLLIALLRR